MHLSKSKYLNLFVAVAFFMKVIFSAGFMPIANGNSLNVIEICTGQGLSQIILQDEEIPSKKSKYQKKCPYSNSLNYGPAEPGNILLFFEYKIDFKIEISNNTILHFTPYKDWESQAPPLTS